MNELQRQMYLSALGVDTYMPRWHLPFAPTSILCELPREEIDVDSSQEVITSISDVRNLSIEEKVHSTANPQIADPIPINTLIGGIFDDKKLVKTNSKSVNASTILAQLNDKPVAAITPFSLSVWRPAEGVMIVDSRNTKLALPTELFLNNILRNFILEKPLKLQEEVLRWPMLENSIAKFTSSDARNELQTWLSVQHEIKPINHLWLMGANAATYILPENLKFTDSVFQCVELDGIVIKAQILPSLNELLQTPSLKRKLFLALNNYHSK